MISDALEKQKKEVDSSSNLPLNQTSPKRIIKPIIKERMEMKGRALKKYSVKRPKARFWEFKGCCSQTDNAKILRKLTSAMRASKNVQKFIFDYPEPTQGDQAEIRYTSSIKWETRNPILKYLIQCLKGQRSVKKVSFDFHGFWEDRKVNEFGLYLLRRGLKSLVSLQSLKLDCSKHPDITKNKAQKVSHAFKTLGSLQNISLNFHRIDWGGNLSDKGVENLAQDLKKLTSLQSLDLQFPNCDGITGTGFESFGQNLSSLPQLQTVQLDFILCREITDEGISCIGQGMKALTSLENFKIKIHFPMEVTEKGIFDFRKGLQEIPLLKNLELQFWGLQEGVKTIDFALGKFNSLQNLKLIFFGCRDLVDIRLLESHQKFASLQKIDLRFVMCSGLTDTVLSRIGAELVLLASLKDIRLGFYNNKFTDQGMESFSKNLRILTSLTALNLGFEECNGFTDTGLFSLSQSFEALSSLKDLELNISSSNFTPEGINHLTQSWIHLPLEKINLTFPQRALNDETMEDLGESLNQITSLREVIVQIGQGENVTKTGENSFFQALSGHQCFKNTKLRTSDKDENN